MSRSWQIFVAPGDDTEPLPIPSSPWHIERMVRIPKEHWWLILDFAESMNRELSDELRATSVAGDGNQDDEIRIPHARLAPLVAFMRQVRDAILTAPPIVPEPTEDVPDDFTNDEHARMLEAVSSVFEEAQRLRQPFRAWVE
jgi:hypothetical protein